MYNETSAPPVATITATHFDLVIGFFGALKYHNKDGFKHKHFVACFSLFHRLIADWLTFEQRVTFKRIL